MHSAVTFLGDEKQCHYGFTLRSVPLKNRKNGALKVSFVVRKIIDRKFVVGGFAVKNEVAIVRRCFEVVRVNICCFVTNEIGSKNEKFLDGLHNFFAVLPVSYFVAENFNQFCFADLF